MILAKRPLTLAEARTFVKELEERKTVEDYFKTFTKLSKEKADNMLEQLKGLNNMKLKEETMIKIADVVPHDSEEVNKIVIDASLTEEETNAILEITKKY